jgi:hypothetical protein
MKSFILFAKENQNDEINEDEMGWVFGMNGREEECI